ncbi:uncharacterized protein VTP21DRAFT_9777 [Calcarisporiella thermophila]|uniref:uncharacterized protein n=1 Tax=Calcarisporiella thermophila TaxID=911321 RepID=UPI003744A26A
MYIEELIIEGFKSYAVRTHITGWDPSFNAITGLNGSGKSNILDAICFVLGITNLSHVRASNLQDLIYKRGQAGVSKASVTIVFNNDDRSKSPVGFEQYKQITVTRQILIGGRCKYIVNGHNAQQQVVQNLFQSVQLNINNPHFLIMQGRITKVLNMKPPEILGMIEEAAGTKMFEDRKNKAFATMAKKEKKVDEINSILTEEIGPKLDRLREEKREYLDYQKTESEMERLTRMAVAYEYKKNEEKLSRSGADFEEKKERIKDLKRGVDQLQSEIVNIDKEIKRISLRREKEMANGGKLQGLEDNAKEFSKELVRIKTQCDLKAGTIADEIKNKDTLIAARKEMEQALKEKKKQFTVQQQKYNSLKSTHDQKAADLRKSEELLQTLTTGVSGKEGHESGYMEQLQEARNEASHAQTEIEQAKLMISHLKRELKEKEPQAIKATKENKGLLEDLERAKRVVEEMKKKLSKISWEPSQEEDLLKRKTAEQQAISELSQKYEKANAQLSNLEFVYSDPTPNFDRRKVKGLVAQLISIDKQNEESSTALEISAGGRLYNVVVENEVVGSQLLEHGKLRRRVTIIPLNKISSFRASAEKVATVKRLAPGKADLALHLIGYDKEVEAAMEFVFGNVLICRDASTAKQLTFNKEVRMKSVTLDGDVYDPSGTLQGGSRPSSSGLLLKVQALRQIREELDSHRRVLDEVQRELEASQAIRMEYHRVKKEVDLKVHEVSLLEARLSKSSHAQFAQQVEEIRAGIAEQEELIVDAQKRGEEANKRCKAIEKEMKDFKNNKDSKLKELQKKVKATKLELQNEAQQVKDLQRDFQTLELEVEQLEKDLELTGTEIENAQAQIDQYQREEAEMKININEIKQKYDEALARLQSEREKLTAFDEELRELEATAKHKHAELTDSQLEIQKITHELERFQKDRTQAQQEIQQMERQYDWIVDQKQHFGQPGTPYDFRHVDIGGCYKMLKQLEEKYDSMRKKINVKVMNMIDNVEKKESSLKQMLATVQKDKKKIEDTIASLEDYKKEALERTWEKVNADFGAIFGDLLPGNSAKLQPPEGQTLLEGLEVKVCLGGVWKQSLTELSGGQRSLIALSLILSLLQFKPAPMYVLDEVDAALDLSHTQNIGNLLRTRFRGSQFIVVSLKDGMFNNANVLFRTRFRDGTSVVERIAQRQVERIAAGVGKENLDGNRVTKGKMSKRIRTQA